MGLRFVRWVVGIIWLVAGCAGELRAENVLLISVDTLRADRLSCYGYQRNHTPSIDRLAREGIRFERAYTEYPLTLPAHSTLLTGTLPLRHGVRENVGFVLGNDQVTLAEALKGRGYDTAAFIGSYVLASRFGMAQGFDVFDEQFGVPFEKAVSATALRRPAEQVAGRYLAWAGTHRGAKTFAFVHFYDPHAPCPAGYDAEVTRVDQAIGRIYDSLAAWGVLSRTHVIFVSDHGESLGEHGESGHGFFLYDATLRVPLIIRPAAGLPRFPGVVTEQVSLVDVMPTILRLVGIEPAPRIQGRDLLSPPILWGSADRLLYAETWVPQLQFGWSPLRSVRRGRYALIEAPRPELYDCVADPGQVENIYTKDPSLTRRYAALLSELSSLSRSGSSPRSTAPPPPDAREKLAALGYLGPSGSGSRGGFGVGIDPKDRISVYERYHEILGMVAGRNLTASVLAAIEALRKRAPELRSVDFLEAQVLEGLGRLPEAAAAFRRGLEAEPANNVARASLGSLLARMGRIEEAEREFRRVVTNDPGDYRSRNNLAGVYATKGFNDLAIAEVKRAVATQPSYAAGWHNLGRLYVQKANWPEAEAALRKAAALDDSDARTHLLLAEVLRKTGNSAEAAKHERRARQLDPSLLPR